MSEETVYDEFDMQFKAERAIVEQLFTTKTLRGTPISKREGDVQSLAASIFITYFDAESRDEVLFGPGCHENVVSEYLEKAEKVYEFCGDLETAKKCLRFLQCVDPKLAAEIVAKL